MRHAGNLKENNKLSVQNHACNFQATFEKIEGELREVNTNNEALKKNFQELSELKEVMTKTQVFFQAVSCYVAIQVECLHQKVTGTQI